MINIQSSVTAPPQQTDRQHLVLLHDLFGNLSNWQQVSDEFSSGHTVQIPKLPLYEFSLTERRLDHLAHYLDRYIENNKLKKVVLVGNSIGGHIALLYTLKYPHKVSKLVLTGSSGLYENSFNRTFPRVKDFAYIREKVSYTFYQKDVVTETLVNEVYDTVQDTGNVLSIITLARAAQKQNLSNCLGRIKVPVLLIWGLQDNITPPEVALKFKELLPDARLRFIDKCGHVPMMEQPALFNQYLKEFLEE
ncbi:alpha/beta hydrolase [Pedobacter sp. BS3]|uniref:alpha/beta fold hydrolase n=1 Tax=Pedobacter sp. BS3 TaxID=2567937 RepID=UPI0011EF6711|nr:alpha/beta hydrolase [Pedobacter sp. BS3]TZF82207.1 alpha/beta hydrolase [Pedobacter sp. BS3]